MKKLSDLENQAPFTFFETFQKDQSSARYILATSPSTSSINLLLTQYFLPKKMRFLLKCLQILYLIFLESFIPSKGPTLISKAKSKD